MGSMGDKEGRCGELGKGTEKTASGDENKEQTNKERETVSTCECEEKSGDDTTFGGTQQGSRITISVQKRMTPYAQVTSSIREVRHPS